MAIIYDYILGKLRLKDKGDGNGIGYIGVYKNYDALVLAHPTANVMDLAYVQESQGTKWLPGPILGTYYPKGSYIWTGTEWESSVDGIVEELEKIVLDVINLTAADSPYSANWWEDINCDCTGGEIVVNFPTAVGNEGYNFRLTKTDSSINKVITTPFGGESILTNWDLDIRNQYTSLFFMSNGVNIGVR